MLSTAPAVVVEEEEVVDGEMLSQRANGGRGVGGTGLGGGARTGAPVVLSELPSSKNNLLPIELHLQSFSIAEEDAHGGLAGQHHTHTARYDSHTIPLDR